MGGIVVAHHQIRGLWTQDLRASIARLIAAPGFIGFVIGWVGSPEEVRLEAATIWAVLSGISNVVSDCFTRFVAPTAHRRGWPLVVALSLGFVLAAPLNVVLNLAFGDLFSFWGVDRNGLDYLGRLTPAAAAASAVMPFALWLSINLLFCRLEGGRLYGRQWSERSPVAVAPVPAPVSQATLPPFLLKAKPSCRHGLVAISAELHYLRIFTHQGEDLILYRFSDAAEELAEMGGIRVHRSWCVVKSEVQDRKGRHVILTNGMRIPIGRSFKHAFDESGS